MTTATAAALSQLDTLIAERSILQHPFYRAWTAGALTRDDLAVYAQVYYPHVAAFPNYLRSAIAVASEDTPAQAAIVTETLADNLRDELSVPAPHSELWLRFAEAVGARRDAVRVRVTPPAPPATRQARVAMVTETFTRLCESGSARALAALYAYESQQPAVSREKIQGLTLHYGIADDRALAYFTVHAEADVAHRDGERRALAACLDAGATREEILDAASQALDAYWRLLDGISVECGRLSAIA